MHLILVQVFMLCFNEVLKMEKNEYNHPWQSYKCQT